MRIAMGADHAGFELKESVKQFLQGKGHEILDLGTQDKTPVDYPDYAEAVAKTLAEGRAERGILICGSGVGASVAANKIPRIRAGLALAHGRARSQETMVAISELEERFISSAPEAWGKIAFCISPDPIIRAILSLFATAPMRFSDSVNDNDDFTLLLLGPRCASAREHIR